MFSSLTPSVSLPILASLLALLSTSHADHAAHCWNPDARLDQSSWHCKRRATHENANYGRYAFCELGLWEMFSCYTQRRVAVEFTKPGANTQDVCRDALADIIDKCWGTNYEYGTYEYEGTNYTMHFCNKRAACEDKFLEVTK